MKEENTHMTFDSKLVCFSALLVYPIAYREKKTATNSESRRLWESRLY